MTVSQTPSSNKKQAEKTGLHAGRHPSKHLKPNNTAGEQLGRNVKRRDLLQQMTRRWRNGDVYSPHDLTGYAMSKFRRKRIRPPIDVLDLLGVDPLREYKVRRF